MPAGTTPVFVATPKSWLAFPITADTALNNPSTGQVTLATGSANGSVVELIRVYATGTTTQGKCRIFLSLDGGTNKRLVQEIDIPAVTASATVAAASGEWVPTVPLVLPDTSAVLYATTHTGDDLVVLACGGDY